MTIPSWLLAILGLDAVLRDGTSVVVRDRTLIMHEGILRAPVVQSASQRQTEESFAYKWAQRSTFESPAFLARVRQWLEQRYGRMDQVSWLPDDGSKALVLDAGCGAAASALELFEPVLDRISYLGVDVSTAVDVAAARFATKKIDAGFLQCDLGDLPFAPGTFDLIFSEGVLHHTDSTERALKALVPLLKPGGRFMFYVYHRKGPIREFSDDYVREKLQELTPEQAWQAMYPLTKLGRILGDLNIEIDVPETIDLLEIPAGKINLQRLFYWHVLKAFHDPALTLDELNHINFDWYAPRNAHRQTPEQVRAWCADCGLVIEREIVEPAGITIIGQLQG